MVINMEDLNTINYDDLEMVSKEVLDLSNTYNKIYNIALEVTDKLNYNQNMISIEYCGDVLNRYDTLANSTPIAEYRYPAHDISLEQNISTEGLLSRIGENIIHFLKKLWQFILNRLKDIYRAFQNLKATTYRLFNKIIKKDNNSTNKFKEVREEIKKEAKSNSDKKADYINKLPTKNIEEAINEYANKAPGYYIYSQSFYSAIDTDTVMEYTNAVTNYVLYVLESVIDQFSLYVKNEDRFDLDTIDFERNITFDILKDIKKYSQTNEYGSRVRKVLEDKLQINKKFEDYVPLVINRSSVMYLAYNLKELKNIKGEENLNKPKIFIDEYTIDNKIKISMEREIDLDKMDRILDNNNLKLVSKIEAHKDRITYLINKVTDLGDLFDTVLKSNNIKNPVVLEAMSRYVNVVVMPILYKLLVKQYSGLVLFFKYRSDIINILTAELERINNEES